ncbi:MAG: T9SS type A sorting domain-containing protein, partial [Bacteroidales bacterium]|nr:T9SS type A sorting domain-containing protein [Bacteroidales bacterium]
MSVYKQNELRRCTIMHLLFLLAFMAVASTPLPAQNYVSIDGQYLDKKSNAIKQTLVSYWRDGVMIAEDTTDAEGFFHFDILMVGLQETDPLNRAEQIHLTAFPNPFSHQTNLDVTLSEEGVLQMFDLNGSLLDRLELKNPGRYLIRWGGKNMQAGLQLCHLTTASESFTVKIICRQAGLDGLQILSRESDPLSPGERITQAGRRIFLFATDSITYNKENTTYLTHPINLNGDTSFTRVGNPGPSITDPIADTTAAEGDTLIWLITEHCYNDEDTNNYGTSSPGTWISGDSLHHVVQSTMTNVLVDIQDVTDTLLSCELSFFVSPSGTN